MRTRPAEKKTGRDDEKYIHGFGVLTDNLMLAKGKARYGIKRCLPCWGSLR